MRVGLMIPCYVDVFYPKVGIATLELLEKLGIEVEYPFDQTCCGQPMANSGCESDARATEEAVAAKMGYDKLDYIGKTGADYIVSSDMSCLMHLQGCARRLQKNLKFRHLAQILNGDRE
jgi:L-lactate dehydrogenase complex protein LldE